MKSEIDCLRRQLNNLVRDNADYREIYELSIKLDSLIASYYRRIYFNHENKKEYIIPI